MTENSNDESVINNLDWSDVQEELKASGGEEAVERAAAMKAEKGQPREKATPGKQEVGAVKFDELQSNGESKGSLDLDFILEIPLKVSAELGRSKMPVGELLSLGPGSVIELDKNAGEPVDIYLNNRLIARGEVVVANERLGVRLTDVVSHSERVTNLR